MTEVLGYPTFAAHGGDIGAYVTNRLGVEAPERVLGIHVTMAAESYIGEGTTPLSDAERAFLRERVAAKEAPATTTSSAPARRHWPTGWPTRRPAWPPGSSTSGGRGATAATTWSAASPKTAAHHRDPVLGDAHDRVVVSGLPRLDAGHGGP